MFGQMHDDKFAEVSDYEGDESWGISEEQSLKQKREFDYRFGERSEQKDSFQSLEPKQLGLWLNGKWAGDEKSLKVVDVRDDDFNQKGHLRAAIRRPTDDFKPEQLVKDLMGVDVVVFYGYLCKGRGPMCAREYIRIQIEKNPKQEVYVLTGGLNEFIKAAETHEELKSLIVYTKKQLPSTVQLNSFREDDRKLDFPQSDDEDQDLSSKDFWPSINFFSTVEKRPYFPLDESPRHKIL